MHDATDLAFMRATQSEALPGTAIIQGTVNLSDGQGGYYETWQNVGTVPARLYPRNNRSYQESASGGAQLISMTTWWVTMPWDTVVDARNRVSMAGRTWEIVSVNNDEDWRTAIRCEVSSLNEENRPT